MKSKLLFGRFLVVGILFSNISSISAQEFNTEEGNKIMETALNYGEGYYSGSGFRMQQALFPDLRKFSIMTLPNFSEPVLVESSYSGLIEMSYQGVGKAEESARKINVKPLAVSSEIACARLTSSQFNDYLHMVKVGDDWKIVNVLWAPGLDSRNRGTVPQLNEEEQRPQIEQTVRQFFEGMYTGNGDQVKLVLHPKFTLAKYTAIKADGEYYIARDGADLLIQLAAAKRTLLPKEDWNFTIKVLDYMDGMAMVEFSTPRGPSFLQVGYVKDKWMIINMLDFRPPAQR